MTKQSKNLHILPFRICCSKVIPLPQETAIALVQALNANYITC
uniref:Uncharacterized protein n=1 Tax=Rhizophora mucronata TaxID=61149 RepID=A0A2P2Q483_RHIMU